MSIFKNHILNLLILVGLTSCAGFSFPEYEILNEGQSVYITEYVSGNCVPMDTVYGTITNSEIKVAVRNSFNMARNKAAKIGANTIKYIDTDYHKVPFSHGIELEFNSYFCPLANDAFDDGSYELANSDVSNRSYQAASQSANFMATQAATQAAMQAASQAAMNAAMQSAAAAASSAASMNMHMP